MFGSLSNAPYRRPGRQPGFKWWILILVLLVGFPLVLLQTVAPSERYAGATTPVATGGNPSPQPPSGETNQFLPEYQPNVIPALDEEAASSAPEPAWLGLVDVVAKLALVLGLMYLVLVGLRWLQRGRRQSGAGGGTTIRLLETVGLAPNRALHLINVGEKTLLIGATDYQVCLLTELPNVSAPPADDEPDAFEAVLQRQTAPAAEAGSVTNVDWHVAVERLRNGAASVRQVLRKSDDAPKA